MTAVPRCSDLDARRHAPSVQLAVGLLCIAIAWTPWAVVWGDAVRDAASDGRDLGTDLADAFRPDAGDAGALPTLFQEAGGDPATFTGLYGRDAATIGAGQQWQRDLLTNDTFQGAAYRALRGPLNRARPDFRADPIWANTDYVLDNFAALTDGFADCDTVTRFTQDTRDAKISDIRVCERLPDLSRQCLTVHDYDDPSDVGLIPTNHHWGDPIDCTWFEVNRLDAEIAQLELDKMTASFWDRWEIQQQIEALEAQRPALVAEATSRVCMSYSTTTAHQDTVLTFRQGAHSTIEEVNAYVYRHCGNSFSRTMDLSAQLANGGAFNFFTFWDHDYLSYINEWVDHPDWIAAGRDPYCGGHLPQYTVRVYFTNTIADRGWSNQACLDAVTQLAQSGICKAPRATCEESPALDAEGCMGGEVFHRLCERDLPASPLPGISALCTRATYAIDCTGVTAGAGSCWIDPQGQEQCLSSDGGNENTCDALEDDPQCGFLRSQCVAGASDAFGNCFVEEEVWDCGLGVGIPTLTREQEHDCAGAVRCIGNDCARFPQEQSQDFAKAVAALQALQMMLLDMECAGADCVIFSGEANECKKAVGGIVNCCNGPNAGVGLGDYITLMLAASKIENAMGLGVTDQVRGAWEVLAGPVDSMWSSVQQSFTSVANSLTGSTTAAATDAAGMAGFEATKQQLMNSVATWTKDVFGQPAAETLFQSVGGGNAFGPGGALLGDAQLASFLTTAMQAILWAYMIYNVAMLLVHLIWTCEEAELQLSAKRELRTCHFVGGYCKDEFLGWCIEKRDAYCCFNSPIARILNEQIRPQLGRGWGAPEHPDCSGIRVSDLARVDWNQVNLDEWLAMLVQSGNFPTQATLNLDDLTGGGHMYAVGGRPDVRSRTMARAQGLAAEALREEASEELENDVLLPVPGSFADSNDMDAVGGGDCTVSAAGSSAQPGVHKEHPSAMITPVDVIDTTITGQIRVDADTWDDDWIGFVVGYRDADDYWVVDWRAATQGGHTEGAALRRVDGDDDIGFGDWGDHLVRDGLQGPGTGWQPGITYAFRLTYSALRVELAVRALSGGALADWTTLLDTSAADIGLVGGFPEGRFGFFNFSQGGVTYSDLETSTVIE
ncbi:conjugal transfer protein TraN [Thiohalocapsa sp.]|uniref:conjugal transfer protein TraN n=1 Tax=Thiohalocapsa sp. TaxID=2497641 RepID=UPI0025F5D2AB|nr:conjugal transfer protein TraN [Thiohalocapsa sp.]